MTQQISIFVVDSDPDQRKSLAEALTNTADIVYLGASPNGILGLMRVRQLKPDLVILDPTLSDMPGPEFTRQITRDLPETGVLISASQGRSAADMTIGALKAGAFDFIVRQNSYLDDEARVVALQRLLLPKIRCFSIKRYSTMARELARGAEPDRSISRIGDQQGRIASAQRKMAGGLQEKKIKVVVIGVSTGGPEALTRLIPALPATFPIPILIVLHMPSVFTGRMADALNQQSKLAVKEAVDGEAMQPGTVYLAPGGKHLTAAKGSDGSAILCTSNAPPEKGCRPSANVLFRSVADLFGDKVLAVIMTGMGGDGTDGLRKLKEHGAAVIAQDAETSVVWGMPGNAVKAEVVDEILPLDAIAGRMVEIIGETR